MKNTKSKTITAILFSIILLIVGIVIVYQGWGFKKTIENITSDSKIQNVEDAIFGNDYFTETYNVQRQTFIVSHSTFYLIRKFAVMIAYGIVYSGVVLIIYSLRKFILSILTLKEFEVQREKVVENDGVIDSEVIENTENTGDETVKIVGENDDEENT